MLVASRRKSLHWFATRCSSFVPLCLSQSMGGIQAGHGWRRATCSRKWLQWWFSSASCWAASLCWSKPQGVCFPNYHPFGMSSVSSSSRRLSPTWEVLTAQQWSRSRSGIHLHNLAMVLLFSPGQGHMDWGTIWLPVARAGMEATVTLAISSFSAKASTILRSLVLVWHQFLSRFEHFKNNDAQFDQLCELQDLYCTIALWLLLWSPEWCVPLKCNVSILSASVGSRCVSHVVCSSQKNAQSVTESLQLQRLPSLLLQSID